MICNNCGAEINDNIRICPNCGAIVSGEKQNVTAASTYVGPMGNPTPVLVWGILGLAFSCFFFTGLLGVIFSIIGLTKAKEYNAFTSGGSSRQATIGKILSIVGVVVGAVSVLLSILFAVGVGGLLLHYRPLLTIG